MGEYVRGEEKKRIGVFVHIQPEAGGSYQYVEFILDALLDCVDLYDITVICTNHEWEKIIQRKYCQFSIYKVIFSFDKMTQEIDSLKFNLLIFPLHGQNLFYELDFKTPLVASIHDLMYYYVPKPGLTYAESTVFYQSLHRRVIGVFVDSELSKRQYGELFGCTSLEKVYVLPFRVSNELYDANETVVSLKNKKYIYYPAQMGEHKNHLNLILAVDFLRKNDVNINLVFSGINNGIYEYIIHLIKELRLDNQIEIAGFLNSAQVKYLYSHARAMIMPTFDGPTNIPPLEAMYMGCPVAISNIFSMPDQVGAAGLLFNPNSVREIAETLKRLWTDDDLCRKLSVAGKKQVEKYSREAFNKKFRDHMNAIVYKQEKLECYMSDLINTCGKYGNIYLYGAGQMGFLIGYQLLRQARVHVVGYVVSNLMDNQRDLLGIPVYELEAIKEDIGNALMVLSLQEKYHEEIIKKLHAENIFNIYITNSQHHLEAWRYYVNTH